MGIDPMGLRPPTSGEIASLHGLYNAYFSSSINRTDAIGEAVTLHRINKVVNAIKSAIDASLNAASDPASLKAVLWAIHRLGNHSWGYEGRVVLEPYSDAGPGTNKCNYFPAGAYVQGAGAINYPDRGAFHLKYSPATANELALGSWSDPILSFPIVNDLQMGDIVSFYSPGDSGHTSLYLGAGLLIYAGPFAVKINTFNALFNDENGSHPSYSIRRYDP